MYTSNPPEALAQMVDLRIHPKRKSIQVLEPRLLKDAALVVLGPPLLQAPSTLRLPVLIRPPERTLVEILSIVNRAVFEGVNDKKAFALYHVAI